jgi:N-methylhydantoinase B
MADKPPASTNLDMFTMVVLRRRVEAIIREMTNALFRSGRSGVLNTAMDFSCSLTDAQFRSISVALGLPVHVGAIHLIPAAIVAKFGDNIAPGDCFVNNSGYLGNTHCADFTLCSPVFHKGKLVFFSVARAHFGDMGFPSPTTYNPRARDVYEEGLMLPCVRIQRGNVDVPEVIDICRANIRVPDQFYGDYLATLSAVRTGEQRLIEFCDKYGPDVVKAFLDDFQQYAERMTVEAIRKLPAGTVKREMRYDSEIAEYPDGIPIRASLTIDPEAGRIVIDLTDNIDNLPLGINMTESTVLAACMTAVFNVLGPDIPRSSGAFSRVEVRMREGSAIGKPKFPAATSAATTNLCHALTPHIQAMFAELGERLGTAYGTIGMPGSCAVVSGRDSRHAGKPFVNQIIMGYWGGPALYNHDGWLTYGSGASQGMLWQSSVEVVEQQQPILVERLEVRTDSGGAGEWEGAPGAHCVFRACEDAVRFMINSASREFPPLGIRGGNAGASMRITKVGSDGNVEEQPISVDVVLLPGERLVSEACGGGGYGNPAARDPERVRLGVIDERISAERARDVYGVVLGGEGMNRTVDVEQTRKLRTTLQNGRGA